MPSPHSNFPHYLKVQHIANSTSLKSLLFVIGDPPWFFSMSLIHHLSSSTSHPLNLTNDFEWWSLPYYSTPHIFCKLLNLETFLDSCSVFKASLFCRWCCRIPTSLYQEACDTWLSYLSLLRLIRGNIKSSISHNLQRKPKVCTWWSAPPHSTDIFRKWTSEAYAQFSRKIEKSKKSNTAFAFKRFIPPWERERDKDMQEMWTSNNASFRKQYKRGTTWLIARRLLQLLFGVEIQKWKKGMWSGSFPWRNDSELEVKGLQDLLAERRKERWVHKMT